MNQVRKALASLVVEMQVFNLSTQEAEASGSLEFEVSLVYRVSSMTARDTQNPSPIPAPTEQKFCVYLLSSPPSLCLTQVFPLTVLAHPLPL